MTREEFLDLLNRYVDGTASEQDRRIFDAFYSSLQNSNGDFWSEWELTEKERIKVEMYQSLNRALDKEERKTDRQKRVFAIPVLRVAASIAIFLGVGLIIYTLLDTYLHRFIFIS